MSIFSGTDMIFYKEGQKIMSGGYSIDSILLKNGLPPMKTIQLSTMQNGGGDGSVATMFGGDLAVPAGLYYINQKSSNTNSDTYTIDNEDLIGDFNGDFNGGFNEGKPKNMEDSTNYEHTMLEDDIHDKLFALVEIDRKRKKHTKRIVKISKKHTKRNKQ